MSTNEEMFYIIDNTAERNIDTDILYRFIRNEYPEFNHEQPEIIVKRKFIEIISNKKYIESLLIYFNINISEFIEMIYMEYKYIFTTYFINKIRDIMKEQQYDNG